MDIFSVLVYHEFKVCDLVALREEHPLVESLDFIQRWVGDVPFPVKVCGRSKYAESVLFGDSLGIFMQEAAVRLQVDNASSLEELAIALQEYRARQPAVLALELGVRESQPYLGYFTDASMNSILVLRKATFGRLLRVANLAPFHSRAPLMSTPM